MPVSWGRLAAYLAAQPAGVGEVTLTYPEIERLTGARPPRRWIAAYRFWSERETHRHALSWRRAGWRVATVGLKDDPPWVTFARGRPPASMLD